MKVEHLSKSYACHQKRLAGRYLREAQSSRDRALLAYLESVADIKFVNETINKSKQYNVSFELLIGSDKGQGSGR